MTPKDKTDWQAVAYTLETMEGKVEGTQKARELLTALEQLMLQTDWGGVPVTKGAFRRAILHALKIMDEYGALVCPHGVKHFEHYCRQCSLQRVDEEYNHVEELQAELAWWHSLIQKHHDNKACPDLKTYVENLQLKSLARLEGWNRANKELAALKQRVTVEKIQTIIDIWIHDEGLGEYDKIPKIAEYDSLALALHKEIWKEKP